MKLKFRLNLTILSWRKEFNKIVRLMGITENELHSRIKNNYVNTYVFAAFTFGMFPTPFLRIGPLNLANC